jgi:hypothetical protein
MGFVSTFLLPLTHLVFPAKNKKVITMRQVTGEVPNNAKQIYKVHELTM